MNASIEDLSIDTAIYIHHTTTVSGIQEISRYPKCCPDGTVTNEEATRSCVNYNFPCDLELRVGNIYSPQFTSRFGLIIQRPHSSWSSNGSNKIVDSTEVNLSQIYRVICDLLRQFPN